MLMFFRICFGEPKGHMSILAFPDIESEILLGLIETAFLHHLRIKLFEYLGPDEWKRTACLQHLYLLVRDRECNRYIDFFR